MIHSKQSDLEPKPELRQQVAEGLLYTHSRLNANSRQARQTAAYVYALLELLDDKGLITPAELETRREVAEQQLIAQFKNEGQGVVFQDPEYDKYAFETGAEIDCASRVPLCRAACCRLPFALSRQDVREGVVHWDLGQPYLIEHGLDGYCIHLDRGPCACTIYPHRPVPCRGFDCRQDKRIWLDFERRIPNPAIEQPDWPYCLGTAEKGNEL
ncbi:MAG: YkgJ family cysteine cluster protein [Anaerolineae bacterium]|nr:YkgJ family cysteine cluster protein [Anaerolineae bacterium]